MTAQILHGDCLQMMAQLADNSVDAVVTDPPYGLSFMGRKWDYDVPAVEIWAECLRVLKPGGHLLAFAGTRTQHRMAVRIEDAGFDIRDMIAWVYGSGFPKSHDVSKGIDKAAGAQRTERLAPKAGHENFVGRDHMKALRESGALSGASGFSRPWMHDPQKVEDSHWDFAPATESARQWQGWGTALKPALEPITVARKPLAGTVAENVLAHATGAMNIDGCRVRDGSETGGEKPVYTANHGNAVYGAGMGGGEWANTGGRWPANLIHDGSEEPTGLLGDAARFFYCAKASKADRDDGCDGMQEKVVCYMATANGTGRPSMTGFTSSRRNSHPTVKPTDLMRYLCRLVTPPGGVVLDPFMGSGSTGRGAVLEGFRFIGIEREAEYVEIARARIAAAAAAVPTPDLFTRKG